jgi:DNA-binding response OmpR family regulator
MNNKTISIFGNQIFLNIIKELNILSKFTFKYVEDLNLCVNEAKEQNQLIIFFRSEKNTKEYDAVIKNTYPLIVVCDSKNSEQNKRREFFEVINMPFKILDFKKKITALLAKYEYKKNSLIFLNGYIINRNERKIEKNSVKLQLSEKEINFLILFSKEKKPISKKFVLKEVWHYSSESETHTVETHIHRLRKKILEKFNDNNFIKNNNKGYFI